jgi:GNAT acetyltransferase-like protein
MIVFERRLGGMIRYRKVFLARSDQLQQLVTDMGPLDIMRVFWHLGNVSNEIPAVFQDEGTSTYVDLCKPPEAILADMRTNCRYDVRRAEKMHERFEIVMNSESARADFLILYNRFASDKTKIRGAGVLERIPPLKPHRFDEYLSHADVFMLYFEGEPTCGHLVLRDEDSRTALLLNAATRRLEPGAATQMVGSLNRYLHWHEMKVYRAAGMEKYDFGGTGSVNRGVTNFKMSFGGSSITIKYFVYVGAAPGFWRLAHSLYRRWSGDRSFRRDAVLADENRTPVT